MYGDLYLEIDYHLREPALERLIDQGRACFAAMVESRAVSLRMLCTSREPTWSQRIYKTDATGTLTVDTYVMASEALEGFKSDNFHPDYAGLSFAIDRGDVLAVGNSVELDLTTDDDLARHDSVLSVSRGSDRQTDAIVVDTDRPTHVLITLRPGLYDVYKERGKGEDEGLFMSLIILPALASVLDRMREGGPTLSDTEWYKSIEAVLSRQGLAVSDIDNGNSDRSSLAIAQRILSQPIERTILGLASEATEEDADEA